MHRAQLCGEPTRGVCCSLHGKWWGARGCVAGSVTRGARAVESSSMPTAAGIWQQFGESKTNSDSSKNKRILTWAGVVWQASRHHLPEAGKHPVWAWKAAASALCGKTGMSRSGWRAALVLRAVVHMPGLQAWSRLAVQAAGFLGSQPRERVPDAVRGQLLLPGMAGAQGPARGCSDQPAPESPLRTSLGSGPTVRHRKDSL